MNSCPAGTAICKSTQNKYGRITNDFDAHLCRLSLILCVFQVLSVQHFGQKKTLDYKAILTVSNAIATGRPLGSAVIMDQTSLSELWGGGENALPATIFLVLSMTLWWYSYEPCEKFMRTDRSVNIEKRYFREIRTDINTSKPEFSKLLDGIHLGS